MATRILGQDSVVTIVQDNQPVAAIDSIKSLEITLQTEILKEQFLGETTDRRDEIFRGVAGKMEAQLSSDALLQLANAIVQRAQNRQSGTRINIKTTFQFPNGDRAMYVLPDVKFGNIPISNKGRTEYVEVSLEFECETMKFITR